ncbi:MAG: SET domain-containing protein [Chloroflexi bacterium]|nr:SET domain-containing protein [Chloroflexota bacterium]
MMLVRTYLDRSSIDGIGIFAAEFIPRGTVVWRFHPVVDVRLTEEQISELAPPSQEQVRKYSYKEIPTGRYVLSNDDARFFNHSSDPNCFDTGVEGTDVTIARRDIYPGEELTCNYAAFDANAAQGDFGFVAEPSADTARAR